MATSEPIASPRLRALQQDLAAGQQQALEAFWQEITVQGTPLIEPCADDPAHVLATFLWRGDAATQNVAVFGGPAHAELDKSLLAQLPGSDVWYRTYTSRADLRTVYALAPNDPLTPLSEAKDFMARIANWTPDPLNRRTFAFPRDPETDQERARQLVLSVIELPQAPPQPWITPRDGVPAGRLTMHRLRSAILGNERRVWVYTPPDYSTSGEPYGLLLVFDGLAYIHMVPTPTTLDNLLAEGRIPPLVAVIPDSLNQEARSRELPCHPPFARYLAEELIPWVRQQYHVTSDPARTVVGGSSYGGLASAYAALQHPEIFGNVLSQSGSYWWLPQGAAEHEWLTHEYALAPRLPVRFYMDVGLLERGPTPGNGPEQLVSNRHMRDVLLAKGYDLHYVEYNGGHDYLCWRGTLADGLLTLIGK